MKRIFFLVLSAYALVGNIEAEETVWQQMGRAMDTEAQIDAIREERLQREEARQNAIDRAEALAAEQAAARARAEAAEAARIKAYKEFIEACKTQNHNNEQRYKDFRASINGGKLFDGDQIPLADVYDDEITIRIYLHDSGYTDLSDAAIAKVRTYMHEHGIKHVSQLAQ